jgi:neutral ceramidase
MIACGTGRRTINPEPGHPICGYGDDYLASGVHDDLLVSAVHLDDGGRTALLVTFDLIGLTTPTQLRFRTAIAKATGVPVAHVFLHCTHVHSAPNPLEPTSFLPGPTQARADYQARLLAWAVEAAVEAKGNAEPCELRYNFAYVDGNMNRRYSFPDRRILYIPDNKQLLGQSTEFVDRELGIIAFRRKGTPNRYKAVITNYTCHPLCVGNSSNLCTADFPGVLRRTVEATFDGCVCVATTGAAGDNHPLMPESGFASAEAMGTALGRQAIMRCYDATLAEDSRLRLAYPEVQLPFKDAATRAMLPEKHARTMKLPSGSEPYRTHVSLLGIGPVLLAGFPGEPMAEHGAMLKWTSPFLKSYALFTATDCLNYFPTMNQFNWGGYEPDTCWFARGTGEMLVRTITDTALALTNEHPLQLSALDAAAAHGHPA